VVQFPLLHKKIMALATSNSVATMKTLQANLREIMMYCTTFNGNILLHTYFDTNYSQIIARSATINNPIDIDILFSAYAVVPSTLFCSYIKNKHDAYTNSMATFSRKELILLTTNKYNLLMLLGIRGTKLLEEEKIIAMQAKLMA
jgi:hypothetical protein